MELKLRHSKRNLKIGYFGTLLFTHNKIRCFTHQSTVGLVFSLRLKQRRTTERFWKKENGRIEETNLELMDLRTKEILESELFDVQSLSMTRTYQRAKTLDVYRRKTLEGSRGGRSLICESRVVTKRVIDGILWGRDGGHRDRGLPG